MKQAMSKWMLVLLCISMALISCAQNGTTKTAPASENTLLWKISGNGLEKPSYLFGTIHLLCTDDAVLSENMKSAIKNADEVYFEVDMSSMMMLSGGGLNMDNPDKLMEMMNTLSKDPGKLMEIMQAMEKMKMNGDTTLQDLLSVADYNKVKKFFNEKSPMIPFEMIETFKPILAVSIVQEGDMPCENATMMEQVVMNEAAKNKIKTNGLETLSYQAGIMDSIPLELQAKELLAYVNGAQGDDKAGKSEESNELWKAYNDQDLKKLENLMLKGDAGLMNYSEVLLYRRNENWVKKLKTLMPGKSLVIAVGAGHLPGDRGVIDLLRKAGYTVTPVENKLIKEKTI